MTAACILVAALVAAAVATWATYRPDHSQHGGSGAGALTVGHLAEQAETETGSSGRHRLRKTVTMCGDLADDIADVPTRILPLPPEVLAADPDDVARDLRVLQRVLAGVRRL